MEFQGFNELKNQLEALGAQAGGRALRNAANAAMTPAIKSVRAAAPRGSVGHKTYQGRTVAPGFLSRNIKKTSFLSKSKRWTAISIGVTPEAFYGLEFVDRGTKTQQKQDWFEPAFERAQTEVLNRFSDDLRKKIAKQAEKIR